MKNLLVNNHPKAIFLDRDGTLNYDGEYLYDIEDIAILPWVKEGLSALKDRWYLLIVITNQSGIGRWYYTFEDALDFTSELQRQLEMSFDDLYLCHHMEQDHCDCRKPGIGNILKAQRKYNLDLSKSYFIGDKESDIICWSSAWCRTVLIKNIQYPYQSLLRPDYIVTTILEFANILP